MTSAHGLRVAGVMTGTSCDGLDVACVRFDGPAGRLHWQPLWSATRPYPARLRERVLAAQIPGTRLSARDWLLLHRDLGRWYAINLRGILARHPAARPHLIANHGQTLAHFPADGLTWQLGDPSLIAHTTGVSVATGFREGDLAAGGQGAPLAPRFHALLADKLGGPRAALAIHNLGGVSNLSYFERGKLVLAFDTGPANFWIDEAAARATHGQRAYDRGGLLARQGTADARAVRAVLRHPYFRKAAPKSTGRDEFPFALLLKHTRAKGADLVATATAITVESIARAYENAVLRPGHPLDAIHFCGGGAKNPAIVEGVARRLPGVKVASLAAAGLDPQQVEAQAFAYYGCLALLGQPLGGTWTGVSGTGNFAPPGHLIPGPNWSRDLRSTLRDTQSRR